MAKPEVRFSGKQKQKQTISNTEEKIAKIGTEMISGTPPETYTLIHSDKFLEETDPSLFCV